MSLVLPTDLQRPVVRSITDHAGPAFGDVMVQLKAHGIHADTKQFDVSWLYFYFLAGLYNLIVFIVFVQSVVEAASWVHQQSRPVVLLHHEDYSEIQHRRTATTDTFMPLSEEEIASYQV